jgi:hypothetical protein
MNIRTARSDGSEKGQIVMAAEMALQKMDARK